VPAQELTWKVTVDPAVAEAAMKSLAQTADTTSKSIEQSVKREADSAIALQKQRSAAIIAELKKVDDYQNQIRRYSSQNYINELSNFQSALRNNTVQAQSSADQFLNLLNDVRGVGTASGESAIKASQFSEALKLIGANAVIAETPIGGLAAELGAMTTEAGAASAAFGPVGLAIGTVVTVAGAAALAIAELNKRAFESAETWGRYGEEIHKAEIVTGLTSQTLGALKVVAAETNTPFESLINTAARFQTAISKAVSQPTGEASRALKFLKLDTEEFKKAAPEEQLLKVAKAISDVQNQADKNHVSQALLNRSYLESAAALDALAHNYEEATRTAEDFGLALTESDVEAAAKFEEQINLLKLGLESLAVQIGQRTAPAIEEALASIADALGLSENSWKDWGAFIGDILTAVVSGTTRAANDIRAALAGFLTGDALGAFLSQDEVERKKQLNLLLQGDVSSGGDLGKDLFGRPGPRFPEQEKTSREKISAGQRLLNQLTDEYNRLLAKNNDLTKVDVVTMELLKKEYQDIDPFIRGRIIAEADLVDQEEEAAKKKKENADFEKELNKEAKQQAQDLISVLRDRAAARVDIENSLTSALQKQSEELSKLKGFEKSHLQTVEELITAAAEQAEKVGGVNDQMRQTFELLIKIAAQEDAIVAHNKLFEGVEAAAGGAKRGPQLDAFAELNKQITDNLTGSKQKAAIAGVAAMSTAFEALGQAVGQAVHSFVLFGNTGGSFRKFAAEVIASIAEMAAVQAVYELAQGLAFLALNFFFPNPAYTAAATAAFQSAAAFGAIAGVAAVAGRGVAGGAFANATGGTAGTSGGSTSGAGSSNSSPAPIVLGSQRQPAIHVTVDLVPNRIFDARVVNVAVGNMATGGALRDATVKEINRQQ